MACAQSSKYIFNQINIILSALEDSHYVMPLEIFDGSTLGQHFRHIMDFYSCIIQGGVRGEVNYACRERSVTIETNIKLAQDHFKELQKQIDVLIASQDIDVVTDFHDDVEHWHEIVKSTIGRELMYAYDHAIHHLAMIKIGIKDNFNDVNLDQSIGVASSTFNHSVPNHNGRKISNF